MGRRHQPKRAPDRAKVEANLTPMIDVTFLLIIFFILVSQIVEIENVQMDLPTPIDPASEMAGDHPRAVLNVVPGEGGRVAGYRLGNALYTPEVAGIEAMTDRLSALLEGNPRLRINLRADRSTHYEWIQPVLEAVTAAARRAGREVAPRLNLVVVRED